MKTFEELLRMTVDAKDKDDNPVEISPEFRVAVQGEKFGGIHIIVHLSGHSGDTLDFVVKGDRLCKLGAFGPPDPPRPENHNPKA